MYCHNRRAWNSVASPSRQITPCLQAELAMAARGINTRHADACTRRDWVTPSPMPTWPVTSWPGRAQLEAASSRLDSMEIAVAARRRTLISTSPRFAPPGDFQCQRRAIFRSTAASCSRH